MIQHSSYKDKEPEFLDSLNQNFLIDSWSYSKVSTFARNEKDFEMQYVCGVRMKSSATTEAGSAYHRALDYFFQQFKEGEKVDLAILEQIAFNYIEEVPANQWKLQKTTPTVADCQTKAYKTVTLLLKNFYGELDTYISEISEVLEVEKYYNEYVVLNGVEIPLPLHAVIDLVVKLKDGRIVVIDHKSKSTFTDDEEAAMIIGTQACSYYLAFESKYGINVDEVWFIENKFSQNKDATQPQIIPIKVTLDQNTRRLYEALLYEKVKRMIAAVQDPDYIFLINDQDNFVDRAELFDFWARTMICEVEDFNVPEAKKELVARRLKKIRDVSIESVTPTVIKAFKERAASFIQYDLSSTNMTNKEKIEHVLRTRGIIVEVAHQFEGYSSNTYLLSFSAGVQIGSIYSKRLDIANALNVSSVRIPSNLFVHEGKSYMPIEFSKKREAILEFDETALHGMAIPLGKDNFSNVITWDLENHSTPHALVCGATGSGKSVLVANTIEYAEMAGVSRIVIIDPKFEFLRFSGKHEVVNEIEEIEMCMAELVVKMNYLVRNGQREMTLIVFDEFADAVAQSRSKMLEENLRILLQKGRSCGFRIMAATQRASVKVITGDAKVNFPVQICFRVPKEVDSKVVLDEPGAESLAGMGDGLIRSPQYPDIVRFQAFFKS